MSVSEYLIGVAGLGVVLAALGFGAARVRAWLVPGWNGAPARLAELTIGVALLIWCAQALGTFALLSGGSLVALTVVVATAVRFLVPRRDHNSEDTPPAPAPGAVATGIAVITVALVVAEWTKPTAFTLTNGIHEWDSLWYHMPFAARFAQEGSITSLHFTSPAFLSWFYPANSELIHAAGIELFGRDLLSPVINLGWLAGASLAAWCLGRPWGLGAATLVAVGIVLASGVLADQAGEARNDIPGICLVLAGSALLVNAAYARAFRLTPGTIALVGLALGLAAGTKLNFLPFVAALTVCILVAIRPPRRHPAILLLVAIIAGGGYWYARNLFHVGNPLPWLASLGPVSLPGPAEIFTGDRETSPIVAYATDFGVWRDWFFPNLEVRFGVLWPLTLLLGVAGAVSSAIRGPRTVQRVLGVSAVVALAAYPLTPLSAAGPEGSPVGFGSNLRYLAPFLGLALALGALQLADAPARVRRAGWTALGALFISAATASSAWDRGPTAPALVVGSLVALAGAAVVLGMPRRSWVGAAAAAGLAVAVAFGWQVQSTYFDERYAERLGRVPQLGQDAAFTWARGVHDARIGTTIMRQYPLYGTDLSNRVDYIGERGAEGSFRDLKSCAAWRAAVNDGRYEYIVTSQNGAAASGKATETKWTEGDPASTELFREGSTAVFRIDGSLDPGSCPPDS